MVSWFPVRRLQHWLSLILSGLYTGNDDLRIEFCLLQPFDRLSQLAHTALICEIAGMNKNIAFGQLWCLVVRV